MGCGVGEGVFEVVEGAQDLIRHRGVVWGKADRGGFVFRGREWFVVVEVIV